MNKTLLAIVGGVVVLLIVAFAFLLFAEAPEYMSEDSPDGVAHNYLLALHNEDFELAFSYLSKNIMSPPESAFEFERNIKNQSWRFRLNSSTTLAIESSEVRGTNAYVDVLETRFNQGGLLDTSQYSNTFELILALEEEEWKIAGGDAYFAWCWEREDGC
jgi:hypothetical protein